MSAAVPVHLEPRGWRILDTDRDQIGDVFEVPTGPGEAGPFLAQLHETEESARVTARGRTRDEAVALVFLQRARFADVLDQLLRDGATEDEVDRG